MNITYLYSLKKWGLIPLYCRRPLHSGCDIKSAEEICQAENQMKNIINKLLFYCPYCMMEIVSY